MSTALLDIIDALGVYANGRDVDVRAVARRARLDLTDRRAHVRLRPRDLERPVRARLKHGPLLTLVDVSAGGALIETPARLTPGSRLVLEFMTPDAQRTRAVTSRVLRAEVASLTGGLQYRGGCAFVTPVPLGELSELRAEPADVLRRRLQAEAVAHLQSLQRGAGPVIARLVDGAIALIVEGRPPGAVFAWVEQTLRQHVPLLAVTVGVPQAHDTAVDALSFDLGDAAGSRGDGVHVVFRPACRLDDPQARFLQAGAAVIGVLYAWGRRTRRAPV